jgi:hypothetical protein
MLVLSAGEGIKHGSRNVQSTEEAILIFYTENSGKTSLRRYLFDKKI